jgi:hypothetical protein
MKVIPVMKSNQRVIPFSQISAMDVMTDKEDKEDKGENLC